jgi:hypothetical protein
VELVQRPHCVTNAAMHRVTSTATSLDLFPVQK